MAYNNPSQAQIDATKSPVKGNLIVDQGKDNHLWASGILKPETSAILTTLYPQYYGTAIFDKLGRFSPVSSSVHDWFEMDRTRKSAEITSGGGIAGPTGLLTLDIEWTPEGGYYLVNDTVYTSYGLQCIVTASVDAGGFQQITLEKVDGTAFLATDLIDGDRIGHISSAFGEGSSAPQARSYYPKQRYNFLTISRRSCKVSGDALTEKLWLDGGDSWFYTQEDIDMEEFMRDRENEQMFGQISGDPSTSTAFALKGEGVQTSLQRGAVNTTYAGPITEDDLQEHMTKLVKSSPAMEFFVPCGADFMKEATQALSDYYVAGAVDYGTFPEAQNLVGIGLRSYEFFGRMFHFAHYNVFDDQETLAFNGTPTADQINFSNYALFINLGQQKSEDLISLVYKELAGEQRKFIYKVKNGMPGDTQNVATGDDFYESFMLSHIGTVTRALNQHGVMQDIGV
jgi:hypothetical protein